MVGKNFTDNIATKKKVAIYTSSYENEKDKESYSNYEQEILLMEYCNKHNLEVYKCYSDRKISKNNIKNKPALKELLSDGEEKKFDMVISWKINRMSRSLADLLKLVYIFEENSITFKSCSEPFETETPMGKMYIHMIASMEELKFNTI